MKVSLNWIQEESNVDIKSVGVNEILHKIGSQLGAVEDVLDLSQKYQGIVTARVISCVKHDNADKLSVCLLDDNGAISSVERNENGLVQVVCGAPNVREGLVVAWLPPGSTVPSSLSTEPFKLESRELRGVMSNGMIASAHELDLSDDHSGILELEGTTPPGLQLAEVLGLDDVIIDLENKMFTHRPDCFGILGVARELAGITGNSYQSPDWYLNPDNSYESESFEEDLNIAIGNQSPDKVMRFMAVVLKDIKVEKSPLWLQVLLSKVGIKSINNVVDITNYIMHLTGQPLHAFDYDKIVNLSDKPSLYPRMSEKGEEITVLGGKKLVLSGEEIVISTDKQPVALAGVIGGIDAEVDESTTRIIIECATFDMYSIRRTSMRHGLFTDAVTRFNKGQSSLQNKPVLLRAIHFMSEIAGAKKASNIYDIYENQDAKESVITNADFINSRLGLALSDEYICELLQRTEIESVIENGKVVVRPPFWRMDIELPEDVVEEVGRLHGYSNIPVKLPVRTTKPTPQNKLFEYKKELRQRLKELGANEVLTYSFVHSNLLEKVDVDPASSSYHIRNAISPDLQYLRPSALPSLLLKVHSNIKSQAGSDNNQFALYEIAKTHQKDNLDQEGLPKSNEVLAFVFAADDKTAKLNNLSTSYYMAKKYLDDITKNQALYARLDSTESTKSGPFALGRSAIVSVNGVSVGIIGEFKSSVRKSLKLPDFSAGFEIDLQKLMDSVKLDVYRPIPSHPVSKQDITLKAPIDRSYSVVLKIVDTVISTEAADKGYQFNIEPISIYAKDDASEQSFSFRITLWHPDKTLTTTEVSELLSKVSI